MRKRGITNFDLAIVDPWSAGYYTPEDDPREHRLLRALTWIREGSEEDNGYARPIEGLIVLFDLDDMEVVEIEDHGIVPVPPKSGNFDPQSVQNPNNVPYFKELRKGLKPLEIVQPEGVSFEIDGNEIRWQNWRFRIGWTPREGIVLYTIGFEDHGKLRPLMYRASITDLFVPYGDPKPTHRRKNAFDAGEYGLGTLACSLELGCDCLGEVRYLDAVMADSDGKPWTIKNAVCIHEEDHGILWKHFDMRTGNNEVRRARRLVLSFIATVANYEYGFYWNFYQDGSIEFESKLTGVISTGALQAGEKPTHGVEVAPGLYGPHHQHYVCARMDMMVDGEKNAVYEVESQSEPRSNENPLGNAWINKETLLAQESEAQRIVSPLTARYWKIVNRSVQNELGQNVSYRLVPGDNVLPFLQPDSSAIKRAGFITKHLWATRYDPNERYAAGDYVNQHPGGAGLPQYTKADRDLVDADVVVGYTFGNHHTVRPEDWPVMPVVRIGFHLKPAGFFVGNPAMDLPASSNEHGVSCSHVQPTSLIAEELAGNAKK
jgi:primary-amine oxidase